MKEKNLLKFILRNSGLLSNGMCGMLGTPLSPNLGNWLDIVIFISYFILVSCSVCFYITNALKNPTLQNYGIIERNVSSYDNESMNCFKLVICVLPDGYSCAFSCIENISSFSEFTVTSLGTVAQSLGIVSFRTKNNNCFKVK